MYANNLLLSLNTKSNFLAEPFELCLKFSYCRFIILQVEDYFAKITFIISLLELLRLT